MAGRRSASRIGAEAIDDAQNHGLTITHMLWHQGESDADARTSATAYKAMFLSMLASIRRRGVDAPVLVSIATSCRKVKKILKSAALRRNWSMVRPESIEVPTLTSSAW